MNKYIKQKDGYILGYTSSGKNFIVDDIGYEKLKNKNVWHTNHGIFCIHENGRTMGIGQFLCDRTTDKVYHRNKISNDYRMCNLYHGNIYTLKGNYYEAECFDGQKFYIDVEKNRSQSHRLQTVGQGRK